MVLSIDAWENRLEKEMKAEQPNTRWEMLA